MNSTSDGVTAKYIVDLEAAQAITGGMRELLAGISKSMSNKPISGVYILQNTMVVGGGMAAGGKNEN